MSEELNKRVGDYEILGTLGIGGMGKVFKVRNVITDRIEAMKILAPDLAGRQDVTDRFLREIKVLATLEHPNIATLRTALKVNDQFVMIMEYVEGTTLSARLGKGPIPVPDVLDYVDQALAGLSYAHQKQVIHRDVKPGNMMLTPNGVVKVMDFGIARAGGDQGMTMSGTTLGSLCYMSPEQVRGQNVDVRSDLYSMGVSLYELVTGERPFRADSDFSLMTAQIEQAPKPPVQMRPDLPAELNEIILTAMAKDPRERFQTADAFRNAVNSVRKTLGDAPTMESIPVPKTIGTSTPVSVPKTEPSTSTRTLEMAHVLFTDIVAYSQLPMDTQEQTLRQLQDIVRGTAEFSRAQGVGQLIILPTGDGMALVFFGDAEAPARCALEMDRVLRKQSGIPLRMGIHTGPVYRVADINANRNVAGGGINMAQRVMDCGDAGHILVSGAVSDVLGQVSTWRQSLHDLGEAEVKHGIRVRIYNLYSDDFGNKETPKKIEAARKAVGATTTATLTPPSIPVPVTAPPAQVPRPAIPSATPLAPPPTGRRGLYMAMGALLVLVVLVAAGLYVPYRNKTRASDSVNPQPSSNGAAKPTETTSTPNTNNGAPVPTTTLPNGAANSNTNSVPTSAVPESTPAPAQQVQKLPAGKHAVASGAPPTQQPVQQDAQAAPSAPPPPDDSAQLEELEQSVDQLSSRAAAVNDSLDNLRRQQAASGFGLRGDISSTQEMMKTHLGRAQAALQAHDLKNAQKYSDQASADVEKLEKFLGR